MDRPLKKSRWRPRRILYLAGGGALGAIVLYMLLAGGGSRLNVRAERIVVSTVERGEFQEFIPLTGTVVPINTYYLDAAEGGRVDTLFVEAGTFVNRGDRILKLANTSLLMDAMYREAEIFQQSNNLRNTRLNMARQDLEMRRQILDLERLIAKQRRVVERNTRLSDKDLLSQEEVEESKEELAYLRRKLDLAGEAQRQDSTFQSADSWSARRRFITAWSR